MILIEGSPHVYLALGWLSVDTPAENDFRVVQGICITPSYSMVTPNPHYGGFAYAYWPYKSLGNVFCVHLPNSTGTSSAHKVEKAETCWTCRYQRTPDVKVLPFSSNLTVQTVAIFLAAI